MKKRRRRRNPAKKDNTLLYLGLGVVGYFVLSAAVPALSIPGIPNPIANADMGGPNFGIQGNSWD